MVVGSSYQGRLARLASSLVLILSAGACAANQPPAPPVPTPTQPPSASNTHASPVPPTGSLAVLTCDDGQGTLPGVSAQASGVSSDVWNSGTALDLKALKDWASSGRTFVKSPLVVSPSTERTTIRVISPNDAALYYTSWSVWNHSPRPSDLVSTARRDVTVGGCRGLRTQMYPGGLVVGSPACVTIEVSSPTARRKIMAPLGKKC